MASHHIRSFSLPSKPHPVAEQFEEHLCRLRSSQTASTSTSSSVSHRLSILVDLYGCVDQLLQLPTNQKAIAHDCQAKQVDVSFDVSLRLLDICGTVRDALLQMRGSVQEIQSALRRRYNGDSNIDKELNEFTRVGKKVKQAIKSCLKEVKKVNRNDEASSVISMLMDVETVTVDVFKSLLMHVVSMQPKKSSWSLSSVISNKKKTGINMIPVENLRSHMVKLEAEIQDLDEALESLFRCMVKSRATLLNILSY